MVLKLSTTLTLTPTSPFNFDATFHKPDHFTSGDNHWEPGTRWQTWYWQDTPLGLKFVGSGTIARPSLAVEVYADQQISPHFLVSLQAEIIYRYNLDLDLAPFYKTLPDDSILGPITRKWRGMRPGHPSSLYEYLLIGIVLQNATVHRSVQMFQALLTHYGQLLEFDHHQLWCFWEPGGLSQISEEELRSLKLGYRAKSIKKIDEQFAAGNIDEFRMRELSREEQMDQLLALYGIGPATVWYLLFDVFHHWDFFNHISPWEQKIYSKLFFGQDPENPVPVDKLLKRFEQYRPYQQLAVHYIWEDLWWQRQHKSIPWLEKLIRI